VALKALCFRNPGERFNTRQIRNLLRNPNAGVVFARARGILAGGTVELAVPAPPGPMFGSPLRCSGRLYALAVHPACRGLCMRKCRLSPVRTIVYKPWMFGRS
jgi:hypothetical protein